MSHDKRNTKCLFGEHISGIGIISCPCTCPKESCCEKTLREYRERLDKRIEHMFVNAPETYHAIKQLIYAG